MSSADDSASGGATAPDHEAPSTRGSPPATKPRSKSSSPAPKLVQSTSVATSSSVATTGATVSTDQQEPVNKKEETLILPTEPLKESAPVNGTQLSVSAIDAVTSKDTMQSTSRNHKDVSISKSVELPAVPPRSKKKLRPASSVENSESVLAYVTKLDMSLQRRSLSLNPKDSKADISSLVKKFTPDPLVLPASPGPSPVTTPMTTPTSNHPRRLRSGMCREDWVLLKKSTHSSISEEEAVLTLPQLVEEHSRNFPMTATVISGLGEQVPFRTTINIHFLKQTKVVDISDCTNQRHLIPFNSAIKFGLVYCPRVKTESFFFEKVSDIIQADDLPKVVTCTKKAKSKNEESSVAVNEVLIVTDIVHGKSAKKLKLKVFSYTNKKEKTLSGDLVGRFTTDPKLAKFHLSEILKYIPDPFPVSVRLYADAGMDLSSLGCLTKEPVVLLDSTIDTSLIASYSQSDESIRNRRIIEVPIVQDIQMGVSYTEHKSNSLERLHADTLSLWTDLMSPVSEKTVHPQVLSAGGNVIQHKLSGMFRTGWEREGQAIKAPDQLRKELSVDVTSSTRQYQMLTEGTTEGNNEYMPLLTASLSSDYYSTTEDDSLSVSRGDTNEDPFQSELEKVVLGTASKESSAPNTPGSSEDCDRESRYSYNPPAARMIRRIEALEMRVANAAHQDKVQRVVRRLEALELRLPSVDTADRLRNKREEELKMEVELLQETVRALRDQVKAMEAEMKEMGGILRNVTHRNTPEKNLKELKKMDAEQILKLLEALDLHRYKETFEEESLTGDVLAECDEEVLAQDLGMSEQLHRSKLMRVIRGEVSPLTVIGDDPYVRFKSN